MDKKSPLNADVHLYYVIDGSTRYQYFLSRDKLK